MATTHTDEKPSQKKRGADTAAAAAADTAVGGARSVSAGDKGATEAEKAGARVAKKAAGGKKSGSTKDGHKTGATKKDASKKDASKKDRLTKKRAKKDAKKDAEKKSAAKKGGVQKGSAAKTATGKGARNRLAENAGSTPAQTTDVAPSPRRPLSGYARLLPAIERIVLLTEGHAHQVRRAVFDSYVSAVVEGGAEAEDLLLLDAREGDPGENVLAPGTEHEAVPAVENKSERADQTTSEAELASAPVHDTGRASGEQTVPAERAPVHDTGHAGGNESASEPIDPDPIRHGSRPRRRRPAFEAEVISAGADRPATDLPVVRTLTALAKQAPPSNNNQRNTVIVAWLQTHDHPVTPQRVAAAYERMSWRVPVNVTASLRTSIRNGLLLVDADDRILVSEAGAVHFR